MNNIKRFVWCSCTVIAAGLGFCAGANAQVVEAGASGSQPPAKEDTLTLSVFQVTTSRDKGYGSTNSIAGSRIDTPLKEVPNYTVTLNEALLKDLGAIEMLDALPYVSGVTPAGTGFADTQNSLRGFALAGTGLRDGLPDTETGTNVSPSDMTSIERIEVSKGPAGVLYGSNSMGGIVNKVSKMPRFDQSVDTQLSVSGGAQEFVRGMVDANGTLGTNRDTAYRIATDYQDGQRSWGGADNKYTIYSVLKHHFGPGKKSAVWGRFMYYYYDVNPNQGVFFLDNNGKAPAFQGKGARDETNLPAGNEVEVATTTHRSYELGYETSFGSPGGSEWSLRVLGRYGSAGGDKNPSWAGGTVVAVDAAGNLLGNTNTILVGDPRIADWRTSLTVRNFQGFSQRSFLNVDLAGKFKTGPADHTLILNSSGGYSQTQRTFTFWNAKFANAPVGAPNTYSLINYAADLANVTVANTIANDTTKFNAFNNNVRGFGWSAGVQDSVAFFKRKLIAVVGSRFDWTMAATRLLNQQLVTTSEATTTNQDWTHKYGLVYAPVEGISLFAQESTTFNAINSIDTTTGKKFPNQQGISHEGGIKLDFFGGRLVGTASIFKMELNNVIIGVVNPPELGGGTRNVAAGTQRTEGWEVDIAYQPLPGLTTLVAYSDLTSVNERGQGFRGVPQTASYSVFAKYSFQGGALKNFGISAGYRLYGKKPVDAVDKFRLGETDTLDLGFYYQRARQPWSAQLNILNALDASDPFTSVAQTSIVRQFPISYRFTANYRF